MGEKPVRVAIVGSRRRTSVKDRQRVLDLIVDLLHEHSSVELVSGGCPQGADNFAEVDAAILKVPIKIFPIDRSTPVAHRGEFTKRAYARNRQVADYADVVYAFVAHDRKGGTENTIGYARELGKPVYVVDGSGRVYLEHEGSTDKVGDP